MKTSNPLSSVVGMETVLTYYGIIPDAEVFDFDSCITTTLTVFPSNTTPIDIYIYIVLSVCCRFH